MKFHQLKPLQRFKVPDDESIYEKIAIGKYNAKRIKPPYNIRLVTFKPDQHIEWRSN